MHNTIRYSDEVGLIEGLLDYEMLIILVEVQVEHKVGREQIVNESDISEVVRETRNSSH
jgi:hypothetical protein